MEDRLAAQRISVDGEMLVEGVRQVSARSEEPILCIARGNSLTLVAISGLRMVVSWEFRLPRRVNGPLAFVIPPMIVSHLLALPDPHLGTTDLVLDRNQVALVTSDELGSYELHWRSDPRTFPALPEMSRLLALPSQLTRQRYLDVSDTVHQAVIQLVGMETQTQIHRTRLAIMVSLANGSLQVTGQEIEARGTHQHCFDPRLIIRALELIKAEYIEVGLTSLGPKSAYLSIVDRQPDRMLHCALLSIGLDTQRLFPLPHGRSS